MQQQCNNINAIINPRLIAYFTKLPIPYILLLFPHHSLSVNLNCRNRPSWQSIIIFSRDLPLNNITLQHPPTPMQYRSFLPRSTHSFHCNKSPRPLIGVRQQIQSLNQCNLAENGQNAPIPHGSCSLLSILRLAFQVPIHKLVLFTALSKCQIWFTICKERKKADKEKQYCLDPLITFFEQIAQRCGIGNLFDMRVLPRKQLRNITMKDMNQRSKNRLAEAVNKGDVALAKELILKGDSMDVLVMLPVDGNRGRRQMKCVHRAAFNGDVQMCKLLSIFGADWQALDNEQMTPVFYAIQSSSMPVLTYLTQEIKVCLNHREIQNRTPFYFACTDGTMSIIKYLYQNKAEINCQSNLGRSALSKACYLGKTEVVEYLLNCKEIQIETADGKGRTALHNAVFGSKGGREGHKFGTFCQDSPECAQMLIERGCHVDYADLEGNTPLHVALSSDAVDSIRVLLAHGASLSLLNKYHETPLMTGCKFGHLQSIRILREQYHASIINKDLFCKNLILLCAKFREMEEDGKMHLNTAYTYIVKELIQEVWVGNSVGQQKHLTITNAKEQFQYTFKQLLVNKVTEQFLIYVKQSFKFNIPIPSLNLQQFQKLLQMYDEQQQNEQIFKAIIKCQNHLHSDNKLLQWLLLRQSTKLTQHLSPSQFTNCMPTLISVIPKLKQRFLTYLLLGTNINWVSYLDENHQNIIHSLIRYKKIGTLIQVLKALTNKDIPILTNKYLPLSALPLIHDTLINKEDKEGFDPFHFAMLLKEAAAAKILEKKQHKWDVKDYKVELQTNQEELRLFKIGYQKQQQLLAFINELNQLDITQEYSFFKDKLMNFSQIWFNISPRPLFYIKTIQQIPLLRALLQQSIVGIDIEYFFVQKYTLISIMQLSSLSTDYIIDMLPNTCYRQFVGALKTIFFRELAYNKKIIKVMHGSDNDLCIIKSVLNTSFVSFLDTSRIDTELRKKEGEQQCLQLKEQEQGKQKGVDKQVRGLATLVQQHLHVVMSKDFQVSEWRIRPIPKAMIDYARRDSMVLPYLVIQMLRLFSAGEIKQVVKNGCIMARKNKKNYLVGNISPL